MFSFFSVYIIMKKGFNTLGTTSKKSRTMEQKTDALIDGLRRQDPAACQRLLTDYGAAVFRLVQRIVPRREDAEEVYQDVFLKALRSIATYDRRQASLATWLGRIAYNESLNFVRGKKPQIIYLDEGSMGAERLSDTPADSQPDEHTIRQLEEAMEKLPPHEQALITMFYYDGLSLADIAYITGSGPSTVGSQLCRIRKKLYRIIKTL